MNRSGVIAGFVLFACSTAPAAAVDAAYKTVSAKSPDAIWAGFKGFCDIVHALPTLKCSLSADGKVRTLTTEDGKTVVEQLEAFDDVGRSYSYTILESGPLPVANYHSKVAVVPEGAGSAIVWNGHFDAKGASDEEAKKVMEGIYKAGADTLAK
jgi:hypothetical protein